MRYIFFLVLHLAIQPLLAQVGLVYSQNCSLYDSIRFVSMTSSKYYSNWEVSFYRKGECIDKDTIEKNRNSSFYCLGVYVENSSENDAVHDWVSDYEKIRLDSHFYIINANVRGMSLPIDSLNKIIEINNLLFLYTPNISELKDKSLIYAYRKNKIWRTKNGILFCDEATGLFQWLLVLDQYYTYAENDKFYPKGNIEIVKKIGNFILVKPFQSESFSTGEAKLTQHYYIISLKSRLVYGVTALEWKVQKNTFSFKTPSGRIINTRKIREIEKLFER